MSPDGVSVGMTLTPWAVLTATAGLVAFHIGLYTLVGRERKSPYVINRVFPIFLLSLTVATIAIASVLVPTAYQNLTLQTATTVLTFTFVCSVVIVSKVA